MVPPELSNKRRLLRSLMNVRPSAPVSKDFLRVRNAYLQERLAQRGVTSLKDLTPMRTGLYLWHGDITTLAVDAIVNAANSSMTGCYIPCHSCIDNAITPVRGYSCVWCVPGAWQDSGKRSPPAGPRSRKPIICPAAMCSTPSVRWIYGTVTKTDQEQVAGCYRSCLNLAAANGLHSVAFCCISTGEFHFPHELAAQIAFETVKDWLRQNPGIVEVIFNVFKDSDDEIYKRLLG